MSENQNPNGTPQTTRADDQICIAALRAENERLTQLVAELREQRRTYANFVAHLLWKDEPEIDAEAVLKEAITQPSFKELIDEIARETGTPK
jgi:predicted metal-dependent phosphoesterase TrpH